MAGSDREEPHVSQREHEILEELRLSGGSSRIQFLAERLSVSEETIRRNLKTLQQNGLVTKVHGGVHLKNIEDEQPLHYRMNTNPEAKRKIAATVASMISDGDRLFLDIGSTTAYIAVALQRHHNLFIVTNSISVAHSLATRNANRVFLAGGELRSHDGGTFGAEAHAFLDRFNLQHAILSVGAVDSRSGFMLHDLEEAELSRNARRHAETSTIVADSHKFGRSAPIIMEDPSVFDRMVTDATPPDDICRMLAENSVELFVAGSTPVSTLAARRSA